MLVGGARTLRAHRHQQVATRSRQRLTLGRIRRNHAGVAGKSLFHRWIIRVAAWGPVLAAVTYCVRPKGVVRYSRAIYRR